ncbi:hypothetical protein KCV07_g1375, partial [Aureobasidium melanogenum]
MNATPTLPVPSSSRPRSVSRSSNHSNPDGFHDHPIATPQEPLLPQTNAPDQLSFARNVPQIYTPTSKETEKPHSKFSEFAEWLETTWYIEIFFLLCSAVCATLIVTFLAIHNNTPTDSWTIYFSINTVISTLGVVFKSTLFIAVSAALAQGKWTWFRKRNRSLSTFEAIHAASRDTLESLKLLWRMRGQHLVSAGALVIALGFMVDPFLQAIISDYGLLVDIDASVHNSTKATIGKSNRFDGGTQCITTFSSRYPKIDTTPNFAVAAALLGSAAWDAADASAMECGLELTLNVYNSSVRNNVLMEQIVASASERVPGSWLPSPNIDQRGIHPNNLSVDSGTPEWNPIYHSTFMYRDDYALDPGALKTNVKENFNVSQRSLVSTLDFLTSLIRQDHDNATVKAVVQIDQPPFYTYGSAILQPLLNQTNTTATFDAIARSMSNAIRNVGNESVSGTAQQWVRYYQVRWAFLTLPLTLFTIGSIFFALSILDAHRSGVPNWKANNTATMLHGPDELLHRDLRDKNHNHSLGVASETMARLECFPEGFALVAADSPVARISRPTTPARDEEEHEMSNLEVPTTPQTPGSNITLVDPQSIGEASGQKTIRSVSPIYNGPGWSDVQLDDSSAPPSLRRSV